MRKTLLLSFGVLLLSGCSLTNTTIEQETGDATKIPETQEIATITQETGIQAQETENLLTYSDPEIGVSFQYPNTWGTINKEYDVNETKYMALLTTNGNVFSVFHNGSNPPARGAFWGDSAQVINSNEYITNFCKDKTSCTFKTNKNGISYVKYIYEAGIMGSDQTKRTISYLLFNLKSSFRGIIISNDRIPNEPETNLDSLVESISFL